MVHRQNKGKDFEREVAHFLEAKMPLVRWQRVPCSGAFSTYQGVDDSRFKGDYHETTINVSEETVYGLLALMTGKTPSKKQREAINDYENQLQPVMKRIAEAHKE